MKTIEQHQTCIEILERVKQCNRQVKLNSKNLKAYSGFPWLVKKYTHNIEIYTMCIARLEQRYDKVFKG